MNEALPYVEAVHAIYDGEADRRLATCRRGW